MNLEFDDKHLLILDVVVVALEKELGIINTDLEGRYEKVRTCETNLGNFMCDILMNTVEIDCALLNGGSLRSDRIHPAGPFKFKDLRDILSFETELIVLSITGIYKKAVFEVK